MWKAVSALVEVVSYFSAIMWRALINRYFERSTWASLLWIEAICVRYFGSFCSYLRKSSKSTQMDRMWKNAKKSLKCHKCRRVSKKCTKMPMDFKNAVECQKHHGLPKTQRIAKSKKVLTFRLFLIFVHVIRRHNTPIILPCSRKTSRKSEKNHFYSLSWYLAE